jgi:hypothetical protein
LNFSIAAPVKGGSGCPTNNPLTGGAGGLDYADVFERMNTFIANLNCTPQRAALPSRAAGWHKAITNMTLAMGGLNS